MTMTRSFTNEVAAQLLASTTAKKQLLQKMLFWLILLFGSNVTFSQNYKITTGGGAMVITDDSSNSDVLLVLENGSNVEFNVTVNLRTYSLNGGATLNMPAVIPLGGITSITINTKGGNDYVNFGAFTPNTLPSVSVNGGIGNDKVTFFNNITFKPDANLDVNLQDDDAPVGVDDVEINAGANVGLSGTGTAVLKASRFVKVGSAASLVTVNGDLTVEANQQVPAATGSFTGVTVDRGKLEASGTGNVNVKGTGGTGTFVHGVILDGTNAKIASGTGNVSVTGNGVGSAGTFANIGVFINGTGVISAGANGTVTVTGFGGTAADGDFNSGVGVNGGGAIKSTDGNTVVTGTGGGTGTGCDKNYGVGVGTGSQISASGTGAVTVIGTGGSAAAGNDNVGVYVSDANSKITAANGNVSVTGLGKGTGANSKYNQGVYINTGGQITGGGASNTVTVQGTGGAAGGSFNYGVFVEKANSKISSSGGNVSVTGQGGGSGSSGNNMGVFVDSLGTITAGLNGSLTVNGTGGLSGGNFNVGVFSGTNATITSSGGNVSVTGIAGGSGTSSNNLGVYVFGAGSISAGTNGQVEIIGTGGATGGLGYGVTVDGLNSKITSSGGDVKITGVENGSVTALGIITLNSASITTNTNGGNILLISNSMDLTNGTSVSTNASASTTLRPYTNNVQIDLGTASDPVGGPLGLSDAELDRITAGTIVIGNNNSGDINVSAAISRTTNTAMQLVCAGDINLNSGGINTAGGNLLLDCGNAPKAVKPIFNGTDATVGTLSFAGDLAVVINGTTAGNGTGSTYTQLVVVGSVNLSGAGLVISGTHTPLVGQSFTIVDNDGTDPINGNFVGLAEGDKMCNFMGSGLTAAITYAGGTGNDVVITVCPNATMTAPSATTVACGNLPASSMISFSNGMTGYCQISGTSSASGLGTQSPAGACGGTVIETWTAVDACGNTIPSVTRIITVSPADLPTMTAPGTIMITCGTTPMASTLTFSNNLSSGCLILGTSATSTFSAQSPAGACGGTITETWTATDACGRTLVPVTRLITVSPAALPTMTAPANSTIACGTTPTSSTLPFSNNLSVGCMISGTSAGSTFSAQSPAGACGGTIMETWTATDACGRSLSPVTRLITVSPAALPTMTAPANSTIACGTTPTSSTLPFSNNLGGGCLISGTSAGSTFSAQVPAGACGGTITETWTATDPCGRTLAPVTRLITVNPATLPTISTPADITVKCSTLLPSASTRPFTNGLSGGCLIAGTSNSSTLNVIVSGNCNGQVQETWTATDICGRTLATVSRTIFVQDNVAPTALCKNISLFLNNSGNASTNAAAVNNGSNDNCSIVSLGLSKTTFNCTNFGPNNVVLTVTDNCMNASTCASTITVSYTQPPVAKCRNAIVMLSSAGNGSITPAGINNASTDLCSANGLTLGLSKTAFNCSNIGPNVVTLTVTNVAGNSSTCTGMVTVRDQVKPIARCKAVSATVASGATVTVLPGAVNNVSTDACTSPPNLSLAPNTFTCGNAGANTVVLTVSDASNNSSTCSAIVTITCSGGLAPEKSIGTQAFADYIELMDLFPNPAADKVNIRLSKVVNAAAAVTILDNTGRTLYSGWIAEGSNQLQVDLNQSRFTSGIYLVSVKLAERVQTKSLVIFRD